MSTANFFDNLAEEGSEDDESFDEETGEVRRKERNNENGHMTDSSEEEDDDDDAEAEAEVRKGFIVDEDDEEDGDREARRQARRERRKRRREEREEDENLDDEDLDLIGELEPSAPQDSRYKRLKRGHREERDRGVDEIFDDEEEVREEPSRRLGGIDEFDDFIEDDELSGEEYEKMREDAEVSRRPNRALAAIKDLQTSGLDEASMEDMRAAFGDGTEYDWALEIQEAGEEMELDPEKPLELKDVFEPSQLIDRMLTDDDNIIKNTDIPERYQILRKPFQTDNLTEDDIRARLEEEHVWVANMMLPAKALEEEFHQPFRMAVKRVLEFINIDNYEPPYIFQHRKDYLIHQPEEGGPAQKLLSPTELWDVLEYDIRFQNLYEKRKALTRNLQNIQEISGKEDATAQELLNSASNLEEVQDVQDYIHFQYAAELKDINTTQAQTNGTQKKSRPEASYYEMIRASTVYNVVRGFGLTADALAKSVGNEAANIYPEDSQDRPDDMADSHTDPVGFQTGSAVLRAARNMFAEEIACSPRMRRYVRRQYYMRGRFDCIRTETGLRKIDEDHPYYEFKYLRQQGLVNFQQHPDLFLRMLQAESEGLVEVRMKHADGDNFRKTLYRKLESDNFSEVADAWNQLRREVLDLALNKLEKMMIKNVKENLKDICEKLLLKKCRDAYHLRLDAAPYRPKTADLGAIARTLVLTNGSGTLNKDLIHYVYVDESGRLIDKGTLKDIRLGVPEKSLLDGPDVETLCKVIQRRGPEVIGVAGMNVESKTLYKDIQAIVESRNIQGPEWEDADGNRQKDLIETTFVNDEVARLYYTSERAVSEFPGISSLQRYCIALARYIQGPVEEYASLGRDILSIKFHKDQHLLPQERLQKSLETAMIDIVNLIGVNINDAAESTQYASLLPYVCGLGPRKAQKLLQVINQNGSHVDQRSDLLGSENSYQAVGPKVFENCASFLYVEFDRQEPDANYLDNTRIHPEDYALANKMAADAMDLDEEDIQHEQEEGGPNAVVRRLVIDDSTDKVNDLVLEEYARQLETSFHSKKRATLETIRAELQNPYEELRHVYEAMHTDEIFTMLTGETKDSLVEGMVVPISIRRIFSDHLEVKMDCGIDGGVSAADYPSGVGIEGLDPKHAFRPGQVMQARLTYLNRKALTAQFSLKEDAIQRPAKKDFDHDQNEWDFAQEDDDKRALAKASEAKQGRAMRVIKHPLFRPFNSKQAEDFLATQGRGDVVIRPSSKGLDHLAVTWKVSENVYQHIDVLELDKENEFSVGRTLKVAGKYTYTDLDELIVNHVKAMAKKVDEITGDDRFQSSNKQQTEQWLNSYMEANPKRAMYAFCMNKDYPGYFDLCFKPGPTSRHQSWPVKIIPRAFELQKNSYPDISALKNGFKLLMLNNQNRRR